MLAIKGRRKCANCGKRYNWYYAKQSSDIQDVKFKGKEDNSCIAKDIKVMSQSSYEVKLNCPECDIEDTFIYTD